MSGARLRSLALGGLALGAVLALVAGSRAWWRAAGTGVSVAFTGTEATGGLAQALALVALAGVLLALVLRARGRRVLGGLLLLAGAGALVLGLLACLLIAGVGSYYASSHPDGLEFVAESAGFSDSAKDSAASDSPIAVKLR